MTKTTINPFIRIPRSGIESAIGSIAAVYADRPIGLLPKVNSRSV